MENKFKDVNPGDYYYDAVMWAIDNGITNGVTENEFGPNNICTTAHVLTFIWRYYSTYNQVEYGNYTTWYGEAVNWAKDNNIVYDNTFDIEDNAQRKDIIYNLYKLSNLD